MDIKNNRAVITHVSNMEHLAQGVSLSLEVAYIPEASNTRDVGIKVNSKRMKTEEEEEREKKKERRRKSPQYTGHRIENSLELIFLDQNPGDKKERKDRRSKDH